MLGSLLVQKGDTDIGEETLMEVLQWRESNLEKDHLETLETQY